MKEGFKKPKRYRAKALGSDTWFEGYYFEMPETTYCCAPEIEPKVLHYLVFHQMTDWGLPNEPKLVEIDMDTIEEVD